MSKASIRIDIDQAKYAVLKSLDLSVLRDISPEYFNKLKKNDYIEYLINNWSIDDLLSEIAIHPDMDDKKWKFLHDILKEMERDDIQRNEEQIKYYFLKNLDQSMISSILPEKFNKLKRRNFIDYLVKNWSLDDIVSELLINPDIFGDKHKLSLLNTLYEQTAKKLQSLYGKKYLRVYKTTTNPKIQNEFNTFDKKSDRNAISFNNVRTTKPFVKQTKLDRFILINKKD